MNDTPAISIPVDLTNPGQFFACCGLLELAGRMWPGAEGWFTDHTFHVLSQAHGADCDLGALLNAAATCSLSDLAPDDSSKSPLYLGAPFDLRLDWWVDARTNGDTFRTWSGRQKGPEIARQMRAAFPECSGSSPLDQSRFVTKPGSSTEAIAPFYFDCRRQPKALDVGFSTDKQDMPVMAYPVVEFLVLVGLQRFRPVAVSAEGTTRYRYFAWQAPLEPCLAAAACAGLSAGRAGVPYSFLLIQRVDDQAYYSFSQAKRERISV